MNIPGCRECRICPIAGTSEDSGSARGCRDSASALSSPQLSPTTRHRCIRRQSTAYDEVLNQRPPPGPCQQRRGSRPFLSPGDTEAGHMDTFRVARRDSLSPDSAAEDGYRKGE